MERREFLKLFGFGLAAVGVVAATMSPAQAATALSGAAEGAAADPDKLIDDLASKQGEDGEFAQFYFYRRRRRFYRRRYYVRRRYYRRRRYYW